MEKPMMAHAAVDAFQENLSDSSLSLNAEGGTYKKISYANADTLRVRAARAQQNVAGRSGYIHPKNPSKIRWDMYCGLLIIYSVTIIPWRIGFEVEAEGFILGFDYCVDICFAFDMLFCFFTGIYEEERLVTDLSIIRTNYLKTWFMPDLLSTVPVDKVVELILNAEESEGALEGDGGIDASCSEGISNGGSVEAGNELAGFRLIRILRLARLLKLMRLLKLSQKASAVDMNEFINPAISKLLAVLGKILFIAHLLSCIWFGVNDCIPLANFEMQARKECLTGPYKPDWVSCGNDSLFSQYIGSFYWTIATMMAVGYGDVSPGTTGEMIFGILTQVVGAMSFGLIIATVGIIVETINPEGTLRKNRLDTLTAFMAERGVTKQLKRQVKDHFEYYYANKTIFNESAIFMSLPPTLRAQLIYEMNKSQLSKLKIFRDLDIVFVTSLVVRLKPMSMQYMQSFGHHDSFNSESYFISKGKVQALYPVEGKEMSVCALFEEGDDFEMDSMLTDQVMRCSYRAISVTDILWMEVEDFRDLAEEYPTCAVRIQAHAMQHKVRMDTAISSETKEISGINFAQASVVFRSEVKAIEDVISFFEVGDMGGSLSKIRTYRLVDVIEEEGDGAEEQNSAAKSKRYSLMNLMTPSSAKVHTTEEEEEVQDSGTVTPVKTEGGGENDAAMDSAAPGRGEEADAFVTPTRKRRNSTIGGLDLTIGGLDASLTRFKYGMVSKKKVQIEVEETTAELAQRYIINPKDGKKIAWDLFIGALIIWSVIIVPFRLGFDEEPEKGTPQDILDIIQDIMFGIDIILCFRVAYLDEHLVYVTEPKAIASHYTKTWFLIDFLSTVPIDRIIEAVSTDESGGVAEAIESVNITSSVNGEADEDSNSAARSLKMIKVLRLIRLSKLARLFKLKNLIKGMDEILALSAVAMKGLQLVTTLIFIGHLFGCFWNYTSMNLSDIIDPSNTNRWWQSEVLPDLKDLSPDDSSRTGKLYVTSLYWAFTTMTTVGYGDVLPTNDVEKVYATLIMILGATIFGYIVGSVGALAVNVNGAGARRHAKVSMAMNYLMEHRLPKSYQVNVKKQILYYVQCKSPFNEDGDLLGILPKELRREMILQTHRELIPHIPLFKRQSRDFISYMLTRMRPQKLSKGQKILDETSAGMGIYFLVSGTVRMAVREKDVEEQISSIFIDPGRFFGHEIYVEDEIVQDEKLSRVYSAVNDCELLVLLDLDVGHILELHPCLGSQLKLALMQMIVAQPPIKVANGRARKQRKSVSAIAFGSLAADQPSEKQEG